MTDNSRPKLHTIAIAAGGTGGHIFPAQAVAEALRDNGHKVVWMTDKRGQEMARNFPAQTIHCLPSGGLAGVSIVKKFKSALLLASGTFSAWRLMGKDRPSVVIGFGGYPSVPPLLAAWFLGIPSVLHEQNAVAGKANRLLMRVANKIALPFKAQQMRGVDNKAADKSFLSGNPVRASIEMIGTTPYVTKLNADKINILVLGGSLGARIMSDAVPGAISMLTNNQRSRLQVVQQARPEDCEHVKDTYEQAGVIAKIAPFFDDIASCISASDLIISRAGASTVAEISIAGRASVLVPYPYAADDHQTQNARALSNADAALVFDEKDFTKEQLSTLLDELVSNPEKLGEMAEKVGQQAITNAATTIITVVEELANKGRTL
jgi:UDP-N-acetylglucosamine--N-acetylmuramyl-(pentapeptide) pyrophosphoryl-undecaprenol N-acetylglucosamine transferase